MGKILSKLILDLGKCPNQKMHESKVQVFQFGRFPKTEISYKSIFLKFFYINTVLNFFLWAFWLVLKVKKRIFHCIFKMRFGWGGALFINKLITKKQNTPKYAYVLVVTWPKPNSITATAPISCVNKNKGGGIKGRWRN